MLSNLLLESDKAPNCYVTMQALACNPVFPHSTREVQGQTLRQILYHNADIYVYDAYMYLYVTNGKPAGVSCYNFGVMAGPIPHASCSSTVLDHACRA